MTSPKGTETPRYACGICKKEQSQKYPVDDFGDHIAEEHFESFMREYRLEHRLRRMGFSVFLFLVVVGIYSSVVFFNQDYSEAIIASTLAVALGFVYALLDINLGEKI